MFTFRVYVADSNEIYLDHVETALRIWTRFRGLMLKTELPLGRGLFIPSCRSVHTFFMRFPVDLIYLDRDCRVVKVANRVKPWRVSACLRARSVLEAPAGSAAEAGLAEGRSLRFEFGEPSHPALQNTEAPTQED